MKRQFIILFALLALFGVRLFGVSAQTEVNWCYFADFTGGNTHGFFVDSGNWVIEDDSGFGAAYNGWQLGSPTGNDVLEFSSSTGVHRALSFDVTYSYIVNNGQNDFTLNFFNSSRTVDLETSLSATTDYKTFDIGAGSYGSYINISYDFPGLGFSSVDLLVINAITIHGRGESNPFGSDNCPSNFPTPTPNPTNSPTPFPSVTPTNTPTITPTPTNTPTITPTTIPEPYECSFNYDFTTGSQLGWSTLSGQGVWSSSGFAPQEISGSRWRLTMVAPSYLRDGSTLITNVSVSGTIAGEFYVAYRFWDENENSVNIDTGRSTAVSPPMQFNGLNGYYAFTFVRENPSMSGLLQNIQINAICTDFPPNSTPQPTATFTPSPTLSPTLDATQVEGTQGASIQLTQTAEFTPSATPTPSVADYCLFTNYSFNNGLSGWSYSLNVNSVPGAAILTDGDSLDQRVTVDDTRYLILEVGIDDGGTSTSDGTANLAFDFASTDGLSNVTGSLNRSESSFYSSGGNSVYFSTAAIDFAALPDGVDTYDFLVDVTLTNINSVSLLSACLTSTPPDTVNQGDDNPDNDTTDETGYTGGWAECGDMLTPPKWYDIAGQVRFMRDGIDKFFECTLVPALDFSINLGNWIVAAILGLVGFLIGLYRYGLGWAANLVIQFNNLAGVLSALALGLLGAAGVIFGGIFGLLALSLDFFLIVLRWMGQLFAVMVAVVIVWINVTPTPIPGLPLCVSAPLDSNVCAVYYLLEYTVFTGAVGSLLLIAVSGLFDFILLIYFIKTSKRIIDAVKWLLGRS